MSVAKVQNKHTILITLLGLIYHIGSPSYEQGLAREFTLLTKMTAYSCVFNKQELNSSETSCDRVGGLIGGVVKKPVSAW
jgi:hypothetical protein